MANLSLTAANVLKTTSTQFSYGTFGETVAAGEWVYLKDDGKLWLADATSAIKADTVGQALNGGAAGQPAQYVFAEDITLSGMTVGTFYFLSATPGKMCPAADLTSGHFVTCLGGATTATNFRINRNALGVAIA